jgi:hypothetical protein
MSFSSANRDQTVFPSPELRGIPPLPVRVHPRELPQQQP